MGHDLLVEREGDVGAAVVVVTGAQVAFVGRSGGITAPAFTLLQTGLHKAVAVPYRQTALARRAAAPPLGAQLARLGTTPHLCTHHFPIGAVASVAVFVPFHSVWGYVAVDGARFSGFFMTVRSRPIGRTQAAVSIDFVYAGGAKGAWRRLTLINIDPTVRSSKSRRTLAPVPVIPINTGPAVVARVGTAVVGILCACGTFPAFFADTGKGLPLHHAGTTVLTGIGKTAGVLGDVARGPLPSWRAFALKRIALVVAGASVVACGFIALAFAGVACLSLPAIFTLAEEVSHQVPARPTVMARVGAAVIYVDLTVVALPAVSADALVHADFVDARAAISAGVALAVVDVFMAVCPPEALVALAAELSTRLAPAAPMRSAHVRRNEALPARSAVGRHGDGAAVNHFTSGGPAVVFEMGAVLALVVFGTRAVVVRGPVKARCPVLTGVGGAVIDIQLAEIP